MVHATIFFLNQSDKEIDGKPPPQKKQMSQKTQALLNQREIWPRPPQLTNACKDFVVRREQNVSLLFYAKNQNVLYLFDICGDKTYLTVGCQITRQKGSKNEEVRTGELEKEMEVEEDLEPKAMEVTTAAVMVTASEEDDDLSDSYESDDNVAYKSLDVQDFHWVVPYSNTFICN